MIEIKDVEGYLNHRKEDLKFLADLSKDDILKIATLLAKIIENSPLGVNQELSDQVKKALDDNIPFVCAGAMDEKSTMNGKLTEVILDNNTIEYLRQNAIVKDYNFQVKELSDEDIEKLKEQGVTNFDDYKVFVYKAKDKEKIMETLQEYLEQNGMNKESFREEMKNYEKKAKEMNKERDKDKNRNQEMSL